MKGDRLTCPVCGREFIAKSVNSKFCSKKCRERARLASVRSVPQVKVCEFCGREFSAKRSNMRYCSEACARRAYDTKEVYQRVCLICGEAFETTNKNKLTCCSACSRELTSQRVRERAATLQQAREDGTYLDREVTTATRLLVRWYFEKDGFIAERIARELKRTPEGIQAILDELGLTEEMRGRAKRKRAKCDPADEPPKEKRQGAPKPAPQAVPVGDEAAPPVRGKKRNWARALAMLEEGLSAEEAAFHTGVSCAQLRSYQEKRGGGHDA